MKSREPVFEKSRSVEDVHHLRLMALLRELVRNKGVMKATQELNVDYRTLTNSLKDGRLSRRMRQALEKALLEGGGSPAAEQRERNDRLEEELKEVKGQVEAVGKEAAGGVAAVRGEVKALGDRQAGFERRLSQVEGTGEDPGDEADDAGGPAKRRTAPWREYPDLVTREPAEGDEEVFGGAWPLISEWRELRDAHPVRGKGFEWLTDEERLLVMELTLLEEHDMTLPAGEAAAAGLRSERADQLAQDSALRHAEGAEKVGASAACGALRYLRPLASVVGHFLRHAV